MIKLFFVYFHENLIVHLPWQNTVIYGPGKCICIVRRQSRTAIFRRCDGNCKTKRKKITLHHTVWSQPKTVQKIQLFQIKKQIPQNRSNPHKREPQCLQFERGERASGSIGKTTPGKSLFTKSSADLKTCKIWKCEAVFANNIHPSITLRGTMQFRGAGPHYNAICHRTETQWYCGQWVECGDTGVPDRLSWAPGGPGPRSTPLADDGYKVSAMGCLFRVSLRGRISDFLSRRCRCNIAFGCVCIIYGEDERIQYAMKCWNVSRILFSLRENNI